MEFKTLNDLQGYYNEMVRKHNEATGTILPVNVLTTKSLVQDLTTQFDKAETPEPVSELKAEEPKAPPTPPQVEDKKPGKKKRDFELVPSQRAEVDNIKNFLIGKDFYRNGVLTRGTKGYDIYQLAGYAGVGKSTIIDVLLEEAGFSPFRVRMCAPTGTAALVLRDKTPDYDAITIHRLIYKWEIEGGKKVRQVVDDNIKGAKLVIADESSMTTREEGENLIAMCKKARVKLLIVGDPGQLPPVDPKAEKEGRIPDFFLLNPDGFLREVMRQAADNPIIKMSMDVRAATDAGVAYQFPMDTNQIGNNIFLRTKTKLHLPTVAKMLQGDGALIVGTNKTRKAFNEALRAFFGFDKPTLMDGEKVLIKENCEDGEVTNGMRGTVSNVRIQSDGLIGFIFTPDKFEGSHYLTVHPDILFERKTKKAMAWENKERRDRGEKMIELGIEMFFGYAITCHASQGSQWKNVYIIDEGWAFNRGQNGYINQNRWTYTAVTRAAENLVVFRGGKLHIPSPEQAKAMAAQLGVKPTLPKETFIVDDVKIIADKDDKGTYINWYSQPFFVKALNKNVRLLASHNPKDDEYPWNGGILEDGETIPFHCYRSEEDTVQEIFEGLYHQLLKMQATEGSVDHIGKLI